jgi:hypothetical protein
MHFTKILLVCFASVLLAGAGTNRTAGAAVGAGNPLLKTLMADGTEPLPRPPLANGFVA